MGKIIDLFTKNKYANDCGIEIAEVRPGFVKCTMDITENHLNGIGIVMGGAIFTLADFTFSLAANSHGMIAISLNAFISYQRKYSYGRITATATEIKRSNYTVVYHVGICDENNRRIAEITGTCYFQETQIE
jgi:acyl-CoA thioesterase